MENSNERLKKVIDYLNLNTHSFAKSIYQSPAGIYNVLVNKSGIGISKNLANRIVGVYPQFSLAWLLTGEGEMLKNNQQIENVSGTGIVGNNVLGGGINDGAIISELMSSMKKKDEQIERLLTIIEKLSK
jgi:hypothetical protein